MNPLRRAYRRASVWAWRSGDYAVPLTLAGLAVFLAWAYLR